MTIAPPTPPARRPLPPACTLVAALLLSALASACGIGTEIGNGVKSTDPNGSSRKSKSDASGASTQPAATPDSQAHEETSSSGSKDSAGSPGTGADTATVPASAAAIDEPLKLLTVACASPFAQILTSPLQLTNAADAKHTPILTAAFTTATAEWTVQAPSSTATARHVKATPAKGEFAVTVSDLMGAAATDGFTCDPPRTQDAALPGAVGVTVKETSVTLHGPEERMTVLHWYIRPADAAAGQSAALLRVEYGAQDTAPTMILVSP
jgi:hypothetical protein